MIAFGLVGLPLGHSLSPQIHACFGDYDYQLYPMEQAELELLLRERAFRGLNVTIPYKQTVLPFCDVLTARAREIGSVNTLVCREGQLLGDNTDALGLQAMLDRAGIALAGRRVAILGSGGTSRTAQWVCRQAGADYHVISRQGPVTYNHLYTNLNDVQILINTTPVGMYPSEGQSPAELDRLPALQAVADVVYRPRETCLLRQARERGLLCADGLWMLVIQAFYSAQLFLGQPLPPALMAQAYERVLNL